MLKGPWLAPAQLVGRPTVLATAGAHVACTLLPLPPLGGREESARLDSSVEPLGGRFEGGFDVPPLGGREVASPQLAGRGAAIALPP